jgi:hypothetical protein
MDVAFGRGIYVYSGFVVLLCSPSHNMACGTRDGLHRFREEYDRRAIIHPQEVTKGLTYVRRVTRSIRTHWSCSVNWGDYLALSRVQVPSTQGSLFERVQFLLSLELEKIQIQQTMICGVVQIRQGTFAA